MVTNPIIKHADDDSWLDKPNVQIKFLCSNYDNQGCSSTRLNPVLKSIGASPHKHTSDEAFYEVNSQIEIQLNDKSLCLKPGDYVLGPVNNRHAFRGLSDDRGLMIASEAPSHCHHFAQKINDAVKALPDDLSKMPDIGNRHQVTVISRSGGH